MSKLAITFPKYRYRYQSISHDINFQLLQEEYQNWDPGLEDELRIKQKEKQRKMVDILYVYVAPKFKEGQYAGNIFVELVNTVPRNFKYGGCYTNF